MYFSKNRTYFLTEIWQNRWFLPKVWPRLFSWTRGLIWLFGESPTTFQKVVGNSTFRKAAVSLTPGRAQDHPGKLPGWSGTIRVKLLLRSHLPRQHYGSSQLTTQDALRAQVKLRFMSVLPRSFPDDAGRAPVDQGRAPVDPGRAPAEPRKIQAEPR
jgi:hypothetical protein